MQDLMSGRVELPLRHHHHRQAQIDGDTVKPIAILSKERSPRCKRAHRHRAGL